MKFKIKIIITIMVSFVVIVSMCFFVSNRNSISISGFNSDTIITGSNNSYLITLKGVPSGNGTYQQLIPINNYTKYGINAEGSNLAFYDAFNLTHLYAWIQSINSTSMQVWVKNYNSSSTIDMQVLPSFENLFSPIGYLGYGRDYFNAYKVFPFATDFANTTGITLSLPATIETYGLNISQSGAVWSTSSFGSGYFGSSFQIVGNAGGNYEYFAVDNRTLYTGNESMISTENSASGYMYYQTRNDGGNNLNGYETTLTYSPTFNGYIYVPSLTPSSVSFDFNGIQYTSTKDLPTYHQTYPAFENFNATSWLHAYYMFYSPVVNMPTFTIVSLYHSIDFKLLGSPFSSLWNIMVNGTTYQANSSNIYLNMTNGYYNIIVNLPAGYSAISKGVLYVNGTNQVYKIFVSYNNTSGISNDIIYAIILASIIVAAAIYFSKRS